MSILGILPLVPALIWLGEALVTVLVAGAVVSAVTPATGCSVPRKGDENSTGDGGTGVTSTYKSCASCHTTYTTKSGTTALEGGLKTNLRNSAHLFHTEAPSGKITDPFGCGRCHEAKTPNDDDVSNGDHPPRDNGNDQNMTRYGKSQVTLRVGNRQPLVFYDDKTQTCQPACHAGKPWAEVDLKPADVRAKTWAPVDPDKPYSIDCNSCHADNPHGDALAKNYLSTPPKKPAEMCVRCHTGTTDDAGNISASGMKTTHVNGSLDKEDQKVCVACHDKHPRTQGIVQDPASLGVLNGNCGDCHVVPTDKFEHPLKPVSFNDKEKCGLCHKPEPDSKKHASPSHKAAGCGTCHGEHVPDPKTPATILKPDHIGSKKGPDRLDFKAFDESVHTLVETPFATYITNANYTSQATTVNVNGVDVTACVLACHGSELPADIGNPDRRPLWDDGQLIGLEMLCGISCHTFKPTPPQPAIGSHTKVIPDNSGANCKRCHTTLNLPKHVNQKLELY